VGAALFLTLTITQPDLHDMVVWMSGAIRYVVVALPVAYVLSSSRLFTRR